MTARMLHPLAIAILGVGVLTLAWLAGLPG